MIKKTLIAVGLILLVFVFLSFVSLFFNQEIRLNDNNQLIVDDNQEGIIEELLSSEKKRSLISRYFNSLEDAGGVSYRAEVVTEWGDVLSFKFWEKGDLVRIETVARGAVPEVYLVNHVSDEHYLYYPSEKRAVTLMESAIESVFSYSLYHHINIIQEKDVVLVRKKETDGVASLLLRVEEKELWIEEETANIVQVKESTEWGNKVVEFSGFNFEDYPDHLFSLPKDTEKGTSFIY